MNSRSTTEQRESSRDTASTSKGFCVVAIGASAGGIEALLTFFEAMPPNAGIAFVVILHLPPDHETQLDSILGRATTLPINVVTDGTVLEPDHIYVSPAGKLMGVTNGVLSVQ